MRGGAVRRWCWLGPRVGMRIDGGDGGGLTLTVGKDARLRCDGTMAELRSCGKSEVLKRLGYRKFGQLMEDG